MVAAKSSRVNRQYKKKYRIRNWREYERGLRSRGDVTIWLSEDAIAAWVPPKNGLRGGQRRYSNLAVRTALTLRVVFSLPLRQTEGFLDSLLRLMGLNRKAPDHTTLSRRNQIVAVPPLTRSYDGPIDLIVDSTGLKILGCGEWNAHKHKASKKRRDWRKLHIGVDAEGFIVAAELTASSRDDASTLPALLDTIEVPIRRFTADGAYDPQVSLRSTQRGRYRERRDCDSPSSALRCRRGQRTAHGRSVTRLLRGFARSGDESGKRSRATDSRRALKTASSDTSPCSEAD